MEKKTDVDSLKNIIAFLEEKPHIIWDPYPQYDKRIYELLASLGIETEYISKHDRIEDKRIDNMNLDDIRTMFTFILRSERFCEGCIAKNLEDETILKLAKRELTLLLNE